MMKIDPVVPRKSVMEFAADMEKKLRLNDHKGGWETCDLEYLLNRLSQEVGELLDAVDSGGVMSVSESRRDAIRMECADVANFAMMIADRHRRDAG